MDAGTDATTAREAMRGLAYSSRELDVPGDSYGVLGEFAHPVEHLQQVMRQLAEWHERHATGAVDEDRVQATWEAHARAAARKLRGVADNLDGVYDAVSTAWTHNGRIIWRESPAPSPVTSASRSALAPVEPIGAMPSLSSRGAIAL